MHQIDTGDAGFLFNPAEPIGNDAPLKKIARTRECHEQVGHSHGSVRPYVALFGIRKR
jgi:hypothetical protein